MNGTRRAISKVASAVRRLLSTLAFGVGIAVLAILIGTQDLEGYDVSFFSLDRGTAVEAVKVLGQPVYTLAVGFGVRLPLHGALGASPAAAVAPLLPAPLIYGLLLTFSVASAAIVVRHALEPLVGGAVTWCALVLLFCSAPMVSYTVYNDWPENAMTYPAYVAAVFAPHALLPLVQSLSTSPGARCLAGLAAAATLFALVALAHAGHWPLLAATLLVAWILALCRPDYRFRTRFAVVAVLAAASFVATVLRVPDVFRELQAAGMGDGMTRLTEGARGSLLFANMFPFGEIGPRSPFTHLVLAVLAVLVGMTSKDARMRMLTIGGALSSILLGMAAATVSPGMSAYAPSITWALRDPATVFAVFSGACAVVIVRSVGGLRRGAALAALALAGLQGLAYAADLVVREARWGRLRWNQNMTSPQVRPSMRGLSANAAPIGARLALWPGVIARMRNQRIPSTHFADAGYLLVTAWTKDRTMKGLIEPNDFLFNQMIELSPEVLCNGDAVRFLQLRYLLLPAGTECATWTRLSGVRVDGWLEVGVAQDGDDRVRALPVARLSEPALRAPALSAGAALLAALVPLPATAVIIDPPGAAVHIEDPSVVQGLALVLPLAYDPAWRASSGQLRNAGGLVALVEVDQPRVTLQFVPDFPAVLNAVAMATAQVLAIGGLLGLAYFAPGTWRDHRKHGNPNSANSPGGRRRVSTSTNTRLPSGSA